METCLGSYLVLYDVRCAVTWYQYLLLLASIQYS